MRVTRDTLQLMLAPGRRLDSTPLQMELLGISQVLFKFVFLSPSLMLFADRAATEHLLDYIYEERYRTT